jgi:flavodoxin
MKKLLFLLAVVTGLSFIPSDKGLTKEEKEKATKFLQDTEEGVLGSVKGLSEAQLKFKPAEDKWSIEDCMKHIAATEMGLWKMTEDNIKLAANPEKRADIKWTDEDVMKNIEDRSTKRKTFAPFEPQNTGFKTMEDAMASFKENRGKLIEYVKTTEADLRNHVAALPVGSFDCYQMILFIAAHSNRHNQQIEEVKADPNFPKK